MAIFKQQCCLNTNPPRGGSSNTRTRKGLDADNKGDGCSNGALAILCALAQCGTPGSISNNDEMSLFSADGTFLACGTETASSDSSADSLALLSSAEAIDAVRHGGRVSKHPRLQSSHAQKNGALGNGGAEEVNVKLIAAKKDQELEELRGLVMCI
jgi:hypothetical protein